MDDNARFEDLKASIHAVDAKHAELKKDMKELEKKVDDVSERTVRIEEQIKTLYNNQRQLREDLVKRDEDLKRDLEEREKRRREDFAERAQQEARRDEEANKRMARTQWTMYILMFLMLLTIIWGAIGNKGFHAVTNATGNLIGVNPVPSAADTP